MKLSEEQIEMGSEKMLAGIRLFEYACEITLAGIRHQNPEANEAECEAILRARLRVARERERAENPDWRP